MAVVNMFDTTCSLGSAEAVAKASYEEKYNNFYDDEEFLVDPGISGVMAGSSSLFIETNDKMAMTKADFLKSMM